MCPYIEDLPNELFLHMFSTYFDGVELYKSFFRLNSRFDCLLKSLNNIHLRLEHSNDDQTFHLYSSKVVSLYIGSKHKSIKLIPLFVNIRSITLVDPTIIQMMYLLEISQTLVHIIIFWSNRNSIDLISARSFYELIFSSSSSKTLYSCRLYLPKSHSLYLEPKDFSLPLLRSLYVQVSIPIGDFRRIIRLCPNLIRLEIDMIDNPSSNEEPILILSHNEHLNIRRLHLHNLLSVDIFDIYISSLPQLENLYISMNLTTHLIDVFKHLSSIINRIDHLKIFHFHFSNHSWNLGQQQLESLKQINPFFGKILIKRQDNQMIFTNK